MENQEIITVDHVSMRFSLASEKIDSFKEYVIKSIKRQIHKCCNKYRIQMHYIPKFHCYR